MTKYDIIIPIGSVCKTSQNLRDLKKQNESLPFDWIFVADLDMIYTALETHFADFLKLENMEYKCKESEQTDIYFDRATGIGFWHDFPHNVPIEKSFDTIKKKYNRRIERLFNEIGQAKDILFLRVCTIRPKSDYSIENIIYHKTVTSDEVVEEQFQRLKALYPDKNVDMLEVSLFNEPHPYLYCVHAPRLSSGAFTLRFKPLDREKENLRIFTLRRKAESNTGGFRIFPPNL